MALSLILQIHTHRNPYIHLDIGGCVDGQWIDGWVCEWGSVDGLLDGQCYDITTGSCLFALGLSLSAITQNRGKGGLRLAFSLSQ